MRFVNTIGFAIVFATAGAASAQTDKLILEDYFGDFHVVQGGNEIGTITRQFHGYAEPFVATGSIQTSPMNGNGTGYEIDYAGNVVNTYNVGPHGGNHDAGTDGSKYIYNSQNFCGGTGAMYRADYNNWQNATFLWNYTVPQGSCGLGTTYDPQNGTIWVQTYGPSFMCEYDLSGNMLTSFPTQFQGYGGLAYESSTNTLWSVDTYGSGQVYQYDKSGNLLQAFSAGGLPNNVYHTAEFVVGVPAPASAGLLGLGGLVAARRRRN